MSAVSEEMLPPPPVPCEIELRDYSYVPLFRARLFGSKFHATATDAEWRAGVTLWLKSWDQSPAGSLPNDDVELCRLAELGRDLKAWRKVRDKALHGWYLCSDGRLYHGVVAEGVLEAAKRRRTASDKGKAGADKRWAEKHASANSAGNSTGIPQPVAQAMPGDSKGLEWIGIHKTPQPPIGGPPVDRSSQERPTRAQRNERKAEAMKAWGAATEAIDEVHRNGNLIGKPRRTWADAEQQMGPRITAAARAVAEFKAIAERSKFDAPDMRDRFISAYLATEPQP